MMTPVRRVQTPRGTSGMRPDGAPEPQRSAFESTREVQAPLFAHDRDVVVTAPGEAGAGTAEMNGLQPAVPYQGATGEFRGGVARGSAGHAAPATVQGLVEQVQHATTRPQAPAATRPTPPALAAQVQQMIYPQPAPGDPVLGFSSDVQRHLRDRQIQRQHAAQQQVPLAVQGQPMMQYAPAQQEVMGPIPVAQGHHPVEMQAQHLYGLQAGVPMQTGYGVAAQHQVSPAFDAPAGIMARAEANDAASFG
jgi:hypothetical protein